MAGRTLVVGDVHGAAKALDQVLERSGFNNKTDTLISLGDIVDGWSESYECVEILLSIKNLIALRGNHDDWFNTFIQTGQHPVSWVHGGDATRASYIKNTHADEYLRGDHIPETHRDFFNKQHLCYTDEKNRFFCHAGFNRYASVSENKSNCPYILYWDRGLWYSALSCGKTKLKTVDNFDEIFIGHTATVNWRAKHDRNRPITTPMNKGGIWNVDTGAGFLGKLTLMDVDTHEYWQSDLVSELYPDERGRGGK